MTFQKNFLLAMALASLQIVNPVQAAQIDRDIAILAAEQEGVEDSEFEEPAVEVYQPEQPAESEQPEKPAEEVISTEVVEVTLQPEQSEQTEQPSENGQTAVENQPAENVQPVGMQNPMIEYATFDELANALNFTPLYIPKKSGYIITKMFAISGTTADIRYNRRWEPNVELQIRTYKRLAEEEVKDISGVYGVRWRIDTTSGTTVYIAKIDEHNQVAAWSSGIYTFSAYVKNLSFAAFHSLVIDELVDLTQHYYR